MRSSLLATGVLVLALGAPALVGAQPAPAPAPTPIVVPTLPPGNAQTNQIINTVIGIGSQIIQRQNALNRNNAHGTVSYFKRFDMQVNCGANCYRNVHLHQGTVINPRGATPSAGTQVDVNGRANPDGTIEADTITVLQ
jgi:hypothetical protein